MTSRVGGCERARTRTHACIGPSKRHIKGKPKPIEPKLEKARILPNMWRLTPPEGYKFDLWSSGRYGINIILRKVEVDRDE